MNLSIGSTITTKTIEKGV